MSNPYHATTADFSSVTGEKDETYVPTVFALSGRIGRVRYLAYSICVAVAIMFAAGIVAALAGSASSTLGGAIIIAAYIPVIVWSLSLVARRLNDMGHSGWYCLMMIIPIISTFFWLWLVFGRGDDFRNEYGAKPSSNTLAVIIGAWILPAICILGIVAAIALPAYQDYVNRARAAAPAVEEVQP